MIYFLALSLSVFFAFKYKRYGRGRYAYVFLCIVVILISGLRYKVGGDSIRYEDYFNLFDKGDILGYSFAAETIEPGWIFLNYLVHSLGGEFWIVQMIHATFINIVIFWVINRYALKRFLAVFMYLALNYFYLNMEILRASIAIALFLLAIPSYINRKWVKYYLLIFIGCLFHFSALILLLFPLLRNYRFTVRRLFQLVILMYIGILFVAPPILTAIGGRVLYNYNTYIEASMNINGVIKLIICYMLFPLIIICLRNKNLKSSVHPMNVFLSPYFIVASISMISTAIGGRLIEFFTIINIIVFTDFIVEAWRYSLFWRRISVAIFTIPFLYVYPGYLADTSMYAPSTHYYNLWYPYTSILERNDAVIKRQVEFREYFVHNMMFMQNK